MCTANFTFGPEGPDFQKIHVIDFGFAAALPRTNNEYPASFCGTPDYASWNLMMGTHPHGARDDVESLIYTLLDFYLRGAENRAYSLVLCMSMLCMLLTSPMLTSVCLACSLALAC